MHEATEKMCDAARWFILARDAGVSKWDDLERCIYERPTIPYIEKQMADNPTGHITKWDVADCIYQLMEQARTRDRATDE